jgi:hypothetical protein
VVIFSGKFIPRRYLRQIVGKRRSRVDRNRSVLAYLKAAVNGPSGSGVRTHTAVIIQHWVQ